LDVGCGNNSPCIIKALCPEIFYVGIDIGNYNQTETNLADEYVISSPDEFADSLANLGKRFDAVLSSHNLEHCNHREKTLEAMIKILKPHGDILLLFPSEKSVEFPSRRGTLNYYDDETHRDKPPIFKDVLEKFKSSRMKIIFAKKSYRPLFLYLMGLLQEHYSKKQKQVLLGTWAYWGFESVIWAKKVE
jgi:SAM-dependent methyltransferase